MTFQAANIQDFLAGGVNDGQFSVVDKKSAGEVSRLAYLGHVLMDNRDGLIAEEMVTTADGTAEVVDTAALMVDNLGGTQRITLGADKGYDRREFVQVLRDKNVTPHVARKRKGSAIDGRTTRHGGYAMSIRRRIEPIFGWMKTIGGMRKTRFRGLERVGLHFFHRCHGLRYPAYRPIGCGLMGEVTSRMQKTAAKKRQEPRKWAQNDRKNAIF